MTGDLVNALSKSLVDNVSYNVRKRIKRYTFYAALLLWLVVLVFPLSWVLLASLTESSFSATQSLRFMPSIDELTVKHWEAILHPDVLQMFFNTIVIATGVMAVTITASSLAGYGLTRYDFPFKLNFARIIIFGYMFSPIALALPMYIIFRHLNLLNTYLGAIMAISAVTIPFSVWLMWKMFQTVPIAKEEAAWMVGATRWKTFKDVAFPAVSSGVFAVGIFSFGIVWMNFTYTRILLPETESMTLAPGLVQLARQGYYIQQGELMAIIVFVTAVPIIISYLMYDYLLKGFKVSS